jgi:hypothetical protein
MTDLRNRVENLKLLIASVEADLAQKNERAKEAHRRGDGAEPLRGLPQISTREVAVEGEQEPPGA